MRAHTDAAGAFEREGIEMGDADNAAALRGFHLRGGGWKGEGWKQVSWRRRKRAEQKQQLLDEQQQHEVAEGKRRSTPLGRMEERSLAVWKGIPRCSAPTRILA
jgi:hypothetical protein